MSVPAVNMLGSVVEPGYTCEAARSSARYMTESMDEDDVTGRIAGRRPTRAGCAGRLHTDLSGIADVSMRAEVASGAVDRAGANG